MNKKTVDRIREAAERAELPSHVSHIMEDLIKSVMATLYYMDIRLPPSSVVPSSGQPCRPSRHAQAGSRLANACIGLTGRFPGRRWTDF